MRRYVSNISGRAKAALYRMAAACNSRNARIHFKLGSAYAQQDAWPAAISAYETALAQDDTEAEWHFNLGIALEKMGRWRDASTAYRAALARDDLDANWHWRLGAANARLEDWPAATLAITEAIARDGQFAEWYLALGNAHARMDNWQDATTAFEAAIARNPNAAAWHGRLGSVKRKLGDLPGAAKAYEAAIFRDPRNANWHVRLASTRMKLEDWSGAVEACHAAIACDETNVELHRRLSRILSKAHDWQGASESYSAAVKVDPQNHLARYRLACSLYRSGKERDAHKAIQPCVDRSNLFLDEFLSEQSKGEATHLTTTSKVLFAIGTNTVLTRKITVKSAANHERTYFEHMRIRRMQCQRIIELYDRLEESGCERLSQYAPKLHHHALGKRFSYFIYEYVEAANDTRPTQIQNAALADPILAKRLVDCLIDVAQSDLLVKSAKARPDRYPASGVGSMQRYIRSQIRLNAHDRQFASALEKVADDWPDHHSRYEQFPRVISHGNFHDKNFALLSDGKIKIFDWELFGHASIALDLVTLFRENWEHDKFESLVDYYFDNLYLKMPDEERRYIVCTLLILESIRRRRPLNKKWAVHLSRF